MATKPQHVTQPASPQPAHWLRELARFKTSPWPWPRSIRAALAVGGPLLAGYLSGHLHMMLWVALGAMMCSGGEGDGSWRSRFRQLSISSLVAATGFLFGYLSGAPYPLTIAIIAAGGFLSAIVSSYGSAFSAGSMQALVFAIIMFGVPEAGSPLESMALYLCGVAVCAALMGIQAIFERTAPERILLIRYLGSVAELARARMGVASDPNAGEAERRVVIDHSTALYAALLERRRNGRTHEIITHAGVLDAAERLFYGILAANDPTTLRTVAGWLEDVVLALRVQDPLPPFTAASGSQVFIAAALLRQRLLAGGDVVQEETPEPSPSRGEDWQSWSRRSAARLSVGRTVLLNGSSVALSMAIAMATRYVLPANHWYWAPLTVAIVLKPDMGSVFARAVLRMGGTIAGTIVGALLVNLIPRGLGIIGAVTLLAAVIPWAKRLSYAAMTFAVTPLVLVLLDMMASPHGVVDLAPERLVNTVIGGLIALVFGYFIWPRSHSSELSQKFADALDALADGLVAACAGDASLAWRRSRACYVRLAEMRAVVSRCLVEPPPAGREAAAWFPLIFDAERICDAIARFGTARGGQAPAASSSEVQRVASALRRMAGGRASAQSDGQISDPLLADMMRQICAMQRRLQQDPLHYGALGPAPSARDD